MSYAQWNQNTQYVVGNQVVNLGVPYICILGVGPTATAPASDLTHWGTALPSGLTLFSSLTWTLDGANGFYSADLTGVSSSLSTGSLLSSTIQMISGYTNADVGTAAGAWLIAVYPSDAASGTLRFFVANTANPAGNTKIAISWAVVRL